MTRERNNSTNSNSGKQSPAPGASIFVTRKIKHNTLQYYAWKIAHVASLIVEHAIICWNLAKKLFHFLIAGTRVWVFMVARLFGFIIILMPGWAALLRYYCFDTFIIRNIDYGKGPRSRNLLDVYLPQPSIPGKGNKRKRKKKQSESDDAVIPPTRNQGKAPVIVFVSGGAWIIGYKLWSGLMARELSRAGYVVIVPDYRNFPQGNIKDMISDIRAALHWASMNCAMFGGDPEQIILAGQSAGAHISLCALVELYEESLARKFIKGDPHASIDMRNRTVNFKSTIHGSCNSDEEVDEVDEEDDDLISCIWRDSVVGCNSDKVPLNMENVQLDEGDSESEVTEDTDEEEVTVSTDALEGHSVSSSLLEHDRNFALSSANLINRRVVAFPTDNSDFMELNVFQDDNEENEEKNGCLERLGRDDDISPIEQPPSIADTCDDDDENALNISNIKMFIGISGPYNMVGLMHHLHERGLDVSILHYIFAFDINKYSPTLRLAKLLGKDITNSLKSQLVTAEESSLSMYKYLFGKKEDAKVAEIKIRNPVLSDSEDSDDESDEMYHSCPMKHVVSETPIESYLLNRLHPFDEDEIESPPSCSHALHDFPSVALFHGSKDKSIPSMVTDELAYLLQCGNVTVSSQTYEDMSHTDPILENVLEGNVGLVVDIINAIERNFDLNSNREALLDSIVKNHANENDKTKNSKRCERYLRSNQSVKWPISKGMMRIARTLNPF